MYFENFIAFVIESFSFFLSLFLSVFVSCSVYPKNFITYRFNVQINCDFHLKKFGVKITLMCVKIKTQFSYLRFYLHCHNLVNLSRGLKAKL